MPADRIFSCGMETQLSYRKAGPLLTACVYVSLMAGQSSPTAQQQEARKDGETIAILNVPAPLGGTIPRLAPLSEGEFHNIVRGDIALGTIYDDNALVVNGQAFDGYQYFVLPNISLQQTRAHTLWTLDYHGGLTAERKAPAASPSIDNAETGTVAVQHVFGRRLLVELRQDYTMTNNTSTSIAQSVSPATVSSPGQMNSNLALPAGSRTTSVSFANLTYQLSRHSSFGVDGSYSTQRFRNVTTSSGSALSLIDTRSTAGRGFYALEMSRRQTIGVEYQIQDLRFQSNQGRTTDQTAFLFDEIRLTSSLELTVFAGPDFAHTHNNVLITGTKASTLIVPALHDQWSSAGGALFTWRGRRPALQLSGQRVIADGSGTLGAIRALSAGANFEMMFTRSWSANLGYIYSDGRFLQGSKQIDSNMTLQQGNLAVDRRLGEHLTARVQYARIQQIGGGTPVPLTTGNHNRVEGDLVFHFMRPLGR